MAIKIHFTTDNEVVWNDGPSPVAAYAYAYAYACSNYYKAVRVKLIELLKEAK